MSHNEKAQNKESPNLRSPNPQRIKSTHKIENQVKAKARTTDPKWINNKGDEVKNVFGFNENAELINARAAMFGFLMLVITELVFKGKATTSSIFGIN